MMNATEQPKQPPINHAAYWAAALARHKAMIAAGCLSPVGAIRVSGGAKKEEQVEETDNES